MHDIVNKAQNITLPVVAINITSISRDESRVFNKLEPAYLPTTLVDSPRRSSKFLMPVPVDIEVSMSIMTRYMSDMDQILSNFVPYNNPYIVLSWALPEEYGLTYNQEIRSNVLWSGSLNYNTPTETSYSDKFRVVVDTSFTIKGWIFPEKKEATGTIYKVTNNFINVDLQNRIYSPLSNTELVEERDYEDYGYETLSSYNDSVPTNYTETITVSGIPNITNLYYSTTGTFTPILQNITIKSSRDNNFILYGKRLDYNNQIYLSASTDNFFTNFQEITSAKSPTISGYKLSEDYYSILNDNVMNINIPSQILSAGSFNVITVNEAGWASSYEASSSYITVEE